MPLARPDRDLTTTLECVSPGPPDWLGAMFRSTGVPGLVDHEPAPTGLGKTHSA